MKERDLFEHQDELPKEMQELLLTWEDSNTYENCEGMLKKSEVLGYTFDYGLDGIPFDLIKMN